MRVHICWIDPKGDRIIDRLMRLLADGAGWSLSDRPDPSASLNYFGLYVDFAQRFTDWRKTPLASYFSHYEPHMPYKKFWWDTAIPLIDIKTVTADQYGQLLGGKVIKVTPPIDHQLFDIRERKPNPQPVIGISGFVAPGGRKGERMVAQLAADLEGKAEIVASGEGWPVRKVNHGLGGLPAFYNSLDLYLCTSTIEGIPIPPLEALACGIPVLIPRSVGMLDELPDMLGIFRYRAGDYDDLLEATQAGLVFAYNFKSGDREALRSITARFTPEAWVESHIDGFEAAMSGKVKLTRAATGEVRIESDRHGKRGVYYVAFGKPARECAAGAIASFKNHLPDISVALVSDEPLGPEDVFIQHPDEDIGGRAAKVKIYDLAPSDWEYIAYLDADTEIISPNPFLWELVEDGWDFVICKNPERFHVASQMRRSDNKDECEATYRIVGTDQVIQLNGGVFCFQRNKRTEAFFHAWYQEWTKYGKRDQAALLRALWKHPLKMFVLGNEWNLIVRYDSPDRAAWLLHFPMLARRWRGIVDHPLSSPEAWKAVEQFERNTK